MFTATPIRSEAPRYGAPLVFLPGLWAGPDTWQAVATYFGHRGWGGALLDLRPVRGGLEARARAVAEYVSRLGSPPILVGHDVGALVALAAAARHPAAAIVLAAPLLPGTPHAHAFTWSWSLVWALLSGGAIGPPGGALAERVFAELPPPMRAALGPDDPRLVAQVGRGYAVAPPHPRLPALLVRGLADPVTSAAAAAELARRCGAEVCEIEQAGHWPMAGPAWQAFVHRVHRWLVRRLGESLLETYAEAMAERGDPDGED